MKQYTPDELKTILAAHLKWRRSWGACGTHANLADADLAGADLAGANLAGAYLADADLAGANLADADLAGADLVRANLADANLADAYLAGANLAGANLAGANLAGAYLADANLVRANLADADLVRAYLADAYLAGAYLANAKNIPDMARLLTQIVPEEGAFRGFKKLADGYIAVLDVPETAKRSNATGRKCRVSEAFVARIYHPDHPEADVTEGRSQHYSDFIYHKGGTVRPRDAFDDNRWNECGSGVHLFITRAEAEAY